MCVEIQFKLHEQRDLSPQQQDNVQHSMYSICKM